MKERAKQFALQVPEDYKVRISEGTSQVGGGTMPDVFLPTFVVGLSHSVLSAEHLARKLRVENGPPIIVRIQNEEIQLDLRTVTKSEEELIIEALRGV